MRIAQVFREDFMKNSKRSSKFAVAVLAAAITATGDGQGPAAPAPAADQNPTTPAAVPPAAAAPAAPAALSTPSVTGPIAMLPPAMFDAGPFGKIAVNGILNGFGSW